MRASNKATNLPSKCKVLHLKMAALFLILYIPVFVLTWFLLDGCCKVLLKTRYKKRYAVIGYTLLVPVIFVLMGLLAVNFLPFAPD